MSEVQYSATAKVVKSISPFFVKKPMRMRFQKSSNTVRERAVIADDKALFCKKKTFALSDITNCW